jgi:hypothetical protein
MGCVEGKWFLIIDYVDSSLNNFIHAFTSYFGKSITNNNIKDRSTVLRNEICIKNST